MERVFDRSEKVRHRTASIDSTTKYVSRSLLLHLFDESLWIVALLRRERMERSRSLRLSWRWNLLWRWRKYPAFDPDSGLA